MRRPLTCGPQSGREGAEGPVALSQGPVAGGGDGGREGGGGRGRHGGQQGALLVAMDQLGREAGVARQQQVQEGGVAVVTHAVRGEGALVRAQALADHPALDVRVEAVLQEDLREGRRQRRR